MSGTLSPKAQLLLAVYDDEEKCKIVVNGNEACNSYQAYGLMIADIVRVVARAFRVEETQVWEWVDKERFAATTEITGTRVQ